MHPAPTMVRMSMQDKRMVAGSIVCVSRWGYLWLVDGISRVTLAGQFVVSTQ